MTRHRKLFPLFITKTTKYQDSTSLHGLGDFILGETSESTNGDTLHSLGDFILGAFRRSSGSRSGRSRGSSTPSTRLVLKRFPKLEILVCSAGADGLAVGADGAVQDTHVVALHVRDLCQTRVGPQRQLVVREPVRREDLLVLAGPDQRGDLGARVDRVDPCARGRVPKVDVCAWVG